MSNIPKLPSNYNLVVFDRVDSTNDVAKRLAIGGKKSCPDGTIVWAKSQSSARGRRGRKWESLDGNLFASIILRPELPPKKASQLSYVSALAIYDMIGELCPPKYETCCKWPNDVLLNGKKVCGILLEASGVTTGNIDWLVIGIGVNIVQHPTVTDYPATSFNGEGIKNIRQEDALVSFGRNFLLWTNRWLNDGFCIIRKNWLSRAKGLNKSIEVRLENETLSGIFSGIDDTGALVLTQDNGNYYKKRIITVGDIFFPDTVL